METGKSLLESKTFWGIMITLIAPMLGIFGVHFGNDPIIQKMAEIIISCIGATIAIYGRITAEKRIV